MKRTTRCFLIVGFIVTIVIISYSLYFNHVLKKVPPYSTCPFCDKMVIERQKYYEDDIVLGIYCFKPYVKGHCLIIPKRHVNRFEELNEKEMIHIMQLIKKTHRAVSQIFDLKNYFLLQKNGHSVGQSVFHLHFHYIPRREEDYSWFSLVLRLFLNPIRHPISQKEIDEKRELIASCFSD